MRRGRHWRCFFDRKGQLALTRLVDEAFAAAAVDHVAELRDEQLQLLIGRKQLGLLLPLLREICGEAGGWFSAAGGVAANSVARWNGTVWSPLAGGVGGVVNTLTLLPNGDLFVGGGFTSADGVIANHMALWNGTAWSVFGGDSFNEAVIALAFDTAGQLVVGGGFTRVGSVTASGIARWSGAAWLPLGLGTNHWVDAVLGLANGDVIAGGRFTMAGGVPANFIARWNGTNWSPLGTGTNGGVTKLVQLPNGDVVALGNFTTAGGNLANRLARWDGAAWHSLGSSSLQPSQIAAMPNGDVVASGAVGNVFEVWRWNGTAWSVLSSGISLFADVTSLVVLPNGDLIAGGNFTSIGGVSASRVARWNGTTWLPLGVGVDPLVYAMTSLPNGDLIVAGTFRMAGGLPAERIARWDGVAWSPLGAGLDDFGRALAAGRNGELAVAGSFAIAGGRLSPHVARFAPTCPATAVVFGSGCLGAGGPNHIAASVLPWLGSTFRARATGMPPLGFVAAVTGFTQLSIPLSLVLPSALPGCSGYVSADWVDVLVPTAGAVQTQLGIPDTAALVGLQFHHYVVPFEVSLGGQITAITSSNALTLTIGSL